MSLYRCVTALGEYGSEWSGVRALLNTNRSLVNGRPSSVTRASTRTRCSRSSVTVSESRAFRRFWWVLVSLLLAEDPVAAQIDDFGV
jgi:hypothetical protein